MSMTKSPVKLANQAAQRVSPDYEARIARLEEKLAALEELAIESDSKTKE